MIRGKPKPKKDRRTGGDYLDAAYHQLQTTHELLTVARLQYQGMVEANTVAGIIRDIMNLEQRVASI